MLYVPDLVSRITRKSTLHAPFVARAIAALTREELADLDAYLAHCVAEGHTVEELSNDYKLVVDDTLREQVYFFRHGRYRFSRYDEVAGSVYESPSYMGSYMRGLAITAFFWPNHAKMRRFFDHKVHGSGGGRYLEVGPGHGLYFLSALRRGGFARYDGIDISPSSVALTERLLGAGRFGRFEGWRISVGDFLQADIEAPSDMLVMGEVLEHVERPDRFLEQARAATHVGSSIFVTTCVNSPAFDHIHLFSSVSEVLAMARGAGLVVEESLVLPHEGTTLEASEEKRLPVNVALVLRHA
jgi:2-polyprenyl-3-methyl-5-hydroxy-6-metoxy-1,4-benzoquinol methylase